VAIVPVASWDGDLLGEGEVVMAKAGLLFVLLTLEYSRLSKTAHLRRVSQPSACRNLAGSSIYLVHDSGRNRCLQELPH